MKSGTKLSAVVLFVGIVALFLLASCTSKNETPTQTPTTPPPVSTPTKEPTPTTTPTPTNTPIPIPKPTATATPRPIQLVDLIQKSIEALAKRLGTSTDLITVTQAYKINWPDTSLGCSKEGVFYAQVIIPGYEIILSDGDSLYPYHSDEKGPPFLCEKRIEKVTTPTPTSTPIPTSAPTPTSTPTQTATPAPTLTPIPTPTHTPTPKSEQTPTATPAPEKCAIMNPPSPPPLIQDPCCIPPFPEIFFGTVTVGGKPAPDGMYVWAKIGNDYQTWGAKVKNGKYSLTVGPLHPKYIGMPIEFYVNGKKADKTDLFDASFEMHPNFDLTIDAC